MKKVIIGLICVCLVYGCTKKKTKSLTNQPQIFRPVEKSRYKPIYAGTELIIDSNYYSVNKRAWLTFQKNGNLVLYIDNEWIGHTNTHKHVPIPDKCVFQKDGDLVLYSADKPVWRSNTGGKDIVLMEVWHNPGMEPEHQFIMSTDKKFIEYVYNSYKEVFPGYLYPNW